jgi:hypothetical protein
LPCFWTDDGDEGKATEELWTCTNALGDERLLVAQPTTKSRQITVETGKMDFTHLSL